MEVDDDCDGTTDDVGGSFVCELGETMLCNTACGVSGLRTCDGCTMFGPCVAAEVCNACDDDGDGADDEDFDCVLGAVETCETTCGNGGGSRSCVAGCSWNECVRATEVCDFCDDTGADGFEDERPMATTTRTVGHRMCVNTFDRMGQAGTQCRAVTNGGDDYIVAELLDGSRNDQAGAVWFDMGEVQGWGTTSLTAQIRARVRPGNGVTDNEFPFGGWSAIFTSADSGSWGVGTPEDRGRPGGVGGLSMDWFWTGRTGYCAPPPNNFPQGTARRTSPASTRGRAASARTCPIARTGRTCPAASRARARGGSRRQ